jgi:hypothetical protein
MEGLQQKQNMEGLGLPTRFSLKTKLSLAFSTKEDVLLLSSFQFLNEKHWKDALISLCLDTPPQRGKIIHY